MLMCEEVMDRIIGAAVRVHRWLGPGLLESAYEACLAHELVTRGIGFERQVTLPVAFEELRVDAGYRVDMIVEEQVIVELKAIERIAPIHEAQLLTYLRLARRPVGLLINFIVT